MYEVYENESYVFLVNELLKGSELIYRISNYGLFNEEYAAKLMRNLLSAITYIHSKNIIHRDLKPENLIFRSKEDDFDICISDFGLADYYDPKGEYVNFNFN